ncbi:uncharacterized protein LOC130649385 [Hydractinia symbiolongicarpus]|uniref:uncharacterized protein LOC130649385 n=1 Tax=Hydractinia symbiolongicarpus TaxID=13093 RepID=UPI0025500912|nr:uncharacterized protein LOC130649385 [Hydractinia symbiolongicarpus]
MRTVILSAVLTALLTIYLLYWCFVLPFKSFYMEEDRYILFTIGLVIHLLLVTIISAFLISSFLIRSNISDQNLYLYIVMAICDLLYSWINHVFVIAILWGNISDKGTIKSMTRVFNYMANTVYVLSISSFIAYSFWTACQIKFARPTVKLLYKVVTIVDLIVVSHIYGAVALRLYDVDSKYASYVDAIIKFFVPMVILITLIIFFANIKKTESTSSINAISVNVVYGVTMVYGSYLAVANLNARADYNLASVFATFYWLILLIKPLLFPLFDKNVREVFRKFFCRSTSTQTTNNYANFSNDEVCVDVRSVDETPSLQTRGGLE